MKLDNESYQHAAARQVFTSWLRELAAKNIDEYVKFGDICWRVNRGAPYYGVYEEYPFMDDDHGNYNWDEVEGHNDDLPPTYAQLVAQGLHPRAVFDIAISHKGCIVIGVEIVHTNGITPAKRETIRKMNEFNTFEVFVVPAAWVLNQVTRPTSFLYTERISG